MVYHYTRFPLLGIPSSTATCVSVRSVQYSHSLKVPSCSLHPDLDQAIPLPFSAYFLAYSVLFLSHLKWNVHYFTFVFPNSYSSPSVAGLVLSILPSSLDNLNLFCKLLPTAIIFHPLISYYASNFYLSRLFFIS